MTVFPLYDNMNKNIKNKDLTLKQKKNLITKFQTLNENDTEIVYMLIRTHEISTEGSEQLTSLPYQGTYSDSTNILFDVENFPNELKQILHKFSLVM